MINLEQVATFVAVVTTGGFRQAAMQTGLSQPAVSQHVKRLEQSLNALLIDRSNAGCTLTPEGRAFLPYAEHLIRTSDRAGSLFRKTSIAVGASSNTGIYLLQPFIKSYQDKTQRRIEVAIADNPTIADRLQNLAIDVAVMEWWNHQPGFVAQVWRREELVVIVPPGHPWAAMRCLPREYLRNTALIGGEAGTGTGRLLQQILGDEARFVGVSHQLGSTEAVKHAVHAGLGISLVLASTVEKERRSGWLCAIPIEGEPPVKEIHVVRRDTGHATAADFIEFLTGG